MVKVLVKFTLLLFNVLLVILGILILVYAMDGFQLWLWILPLSLFGLAGLGAYGTCAEKKGCLIAVCVLMGIIIVLMVCFGIFLWVIFNIDVTSLLDPNQGHPILVLLRVFFGTSALMFVGGILTSCMLSQIDKRRDIPPELDPTL